MARSRIISLRQRITSRRSTSGFTIVELLVVIVVIAILAAIAIAAFTGIQSRAVDSSLQGDLSRAKKFMEISYAESGAYPPNLGGGSQSAGVSLAPSTNQTYTISNVTSTGYCVSAVNSRFPAVVWSVRNNEAPKKQACGGGSMALLIDSTPDASSSIVTWTAIPGATSYSYIIQNGAGCTTSCTDGGSGTTATTSLTLPCSGNTFDYKITVTAQPGSIASGIANWTCPT